MFGCWMYIFLAAQLHLQTIIEIISNYNTNSQGRAISSYPGFLQTFLQLILIYF